MGGVSADGAGGGLSVDDCKAVWRAGHCGGGGGAAAAADCLVSNRMVIGIVPCLLDGLVQLPTNTPDLSVRSREKPFPSSRGPGFQLPRAALDSIGKPCANIRRVQTNRRSRIGQSLEFSLVPWCLVSRWATHSMMRSLAQSRASTVL